MDPVDTAPPLPAPPAPPLARTIYPLISITKRLQEKESSSSSDSSDDEVFLELVNTQSQRKIEKKARIINYVELTVNIYSDADFQSHFRLTRSTFEYLLTLIGENLVNKKYGQPQVDPEKQILVALWRMGNTESYRSVSDRFDLPKSTAHWCVTRVTKALVQNISKFIHWPSPTEANTIKRGFERMSGFPNTVGAIDGTHIEIEAPKQNPSDYINRKGYPSIQLQAVCDDKMMFRHVFVGFPGSVYDQRIFRNSPVQEYLNDSTKFPANTHLIGDAAYTIHQHLLTPYKDNGHLTSRQKNYNYCLSSARVTIERSFGLLKGRWRSLLNCLPMKRMTRMPQFIAACCILHNICISKNDTIDIDLTRNQRESEPESGIIDEQNEEMHQHGRSKRNFIMDSLAIRDV